MGASELYLIFDTETCGVPLRYDAPLSDLANWPRVVQLAWMLCDGAGNALQSAADLIRPEGFRIPPEASAVHGITTERAERDGRPLRRVLEKFLLALPGATLVAHNLDFDEKVTGAELLRAGLPNPLPSMPKVCTMRGATDFCALPGRYGYKWPQLDQLHRKLFGEPVSGAHDAVQDVSACARCFFELRRRQVL